jgi:hypothetical protein
MMGHGGEPRKGQRRRSAAQAARKRGGGVSERVLSEPSARPATIIIRPPDEMNERMHAGRAGSWPRSSNRPTQQASGSDLARTRSFAALAPPASVIDEACMQERGRVRKREAQAGRCRTDACVARGSREVREPPPSVSSDRPSESERDATGMGTWSLDAEAPYCEERCENECIGRGPTPSSTYSARAVGSGAGCTPRATARRAKLVKKRAVKTLSGRKSRGGGE